MAKAYKKSIVSMNGFGKDSAKIREEYREQGLFYVIGYGQWLDWSAIEPDTLQLVQKFWDDGNALFDLLASGKVVDAVACLRNGPWSGEDIARLLPELDEWALALSPERRLLGAFGIETLRMLSKRGMEDYYVALLDKHRESAEAAETLQAALEAVGLEFLDTGAMYDANGDMEGPRDLVMGVPNADTEFAFRVFHSPRRAEYDGSLPEEVASAVQQWEVAK